LADLSTPTPERGGGVNVKGRKNGMRGVSDWEITG